MKNARPPKLGPEELRTITSRTLCHYDQNAQGFWAGTKDHDVSQNIGEFLAALPAKGKLTILELGCGPGRDVLAFKKLGHEVIGLDGSAAFVQMARQLTGRPIWHQDFLNLQLPDAYFHGVFANASLFHVPRQELPRVLEQLHRTLKAGGVLFTSNPRGNEEGWHGARYGCYMEIEIYRKFLNRAGFEILKYYYRPAGRPCQEQPWLAVVSRKIQRAA